MMNPAGGMLFADSVGTDGSVSGTQSFVKTIRASDQMLVRTYVRRRG